VWIRSAFRRTARNHSDIKTPGHASKAIGLVAVRVYDQAVRVRLARRAFTTSVYEGEVTAMMRCLTTKLAMACLVAAPCGTAAAAAGVTGVAFSPDGKMVATAGTDPTVRLSALDRTRNRYHFTGYCVAFSPDGKTLATGGLDRTVRLWDARTGRGRISMQDHRLAVLAVAFSPDGRLLASGSRDKTVKLWDTVAGRVRNTLRGHPGLVRCVAFSPDGKMLASGSRDKTIKLWDVGTGSLRSSLLGHQNEICAVAFSPDGQTLASASYDQTFKLWNVATGRLISTIEEPDAAGGGRRVPSSRGGSALMPDIYGGPPSLVYFVDFSPDGKTLVTRSQNGMVRLWDLSTGRLRARWQGDRQARCLAISPDGATLAFGHQNHNVQLRDVMTGRERGPR
jgi:WD40 repeat protein